MARTRSAAWLTALFGLGVLLLLLSALPASEGIEARGTSIIAPLSGGVRDAVRPIADIILRSGQISELTEDNAELRQTVARLEAELATLREGQIEARQLAALTNAVGNLDAGQFVTAAVLLHDPTASRQIITIDRGATDGVVSGQAVLGPAGTLVAIITDVQTRTSRARLLSDAASAVAVVAQGSRTKGALSGGSDGLRMEFVAVEAAVNVGDIVLSSALGGYLPGGLLIGQVTSVESDERALFAKVEVEPLTDYSRLEHVVVLTDPRAVPVTDLESVPVDESDAASGEATTAEAEAAEEGSDERDEQP